MKYLKKNFFSKLQFFLNRAKINLAPKWFPELHKSMQRILS